MKNVIIALLVLSTVGLAGLCFWQAKQSQEARARAQIAKAEAEVKAQQVRELEVTQKRFDGQREEMLRQLEGLAAIVQRQHTSAPVVAAAAPLTRPATVVEEAKPTRDPGAAFGKLMSKMMDDPEIKNMIREQQKAALEKLYSPLFKEMNLTTDEAAKLKDLLEEKQLKAAERGMALLTETNRADAFRGVAEEQQRYDQQIKDLLGDSRYGQYLDYQSTLGDRAVLDQFKQQNSSGENALTDAQQQQLLAIMKEERATAAASQPAPSPGTGDPANVDAALSDETAQRALALQDTTNQRVLERARNVLNPGQIQSFEKFQQNQLRMQRMSLNMARQLFSPEGGQDAKPPGR